MSLAIIAPPVAGLAETGIFLKAGDAAGVLGFEFKEMGAVVFFLAVRFAFCFLIWS